MSDEKEMTVAEVLRREKMRKRGLIEGRFLPGVRLFGVVLWQQINRNNTFSLAAALTYKTLFSLLPIFVLSLLILSGIPTGEGSSALDRSVKQVIFEQLSLDKLPLTGANGAVVEDPNTHQPITAEKIISPLLEKAKASITSKWTGIIALGVLLYSALTLMIVIEGAFNQIYGAATPRKWWRRILMYLCVFIVGPLGIAGSIWIGRSAYSTANDVVAMWRFVPSLDFMAGLAVSWVVLVLLYKLIPHTRVNWKSAIVGALLAAVAWEAGKWGFNIYVVTSLKSSWYGSLVLIPLFMTWIYVTWSVILMGLETAYLHQYFGMLKVRFYSTRGIAKVTDVRWVLLMGILLVKRFREGRAMRSDEAAESLMIPNDVSEQLLEGLVAAGIVKAVRGDAYRLAREPEGVTAQDLLLAGRAYCHVPTEVGEGAVVEAGSPALKELAAMEEKWAKGWTLAGLAGEGAKG